MHGIKFIDIEQNEMTIWHQNTVIEIDIEGDGSQYILLNKEDVIYLKEELERLIKKLDDE